MCDKHTLHSFRILGISDLDSPPAEDQTGDPHEGLTLVMLDRQLKNLDARLAKVEKGLGQALWRILVIMTTLSMKSDIMDHRISVMEKEVESILKNRARGI